MRLRIRNARIVDSEAGAITEGDLLVRDSLVERAGGRSGGSADKDIDARGRYAIPGLIDAHVHIESSLLTPSGFAGLALKHGTTAVIADCHEICNIIGIEGIGLFARETRKLPLRVFFAIPSCVPASRLGTSGAVLGVCDIRMAARMERVVALGEVMDFPAVIARDRKVMAKIRACKGKTINGHAPGLRGEAMRRYFSAGMMDDHESLGYAEMAEKADAGVMIFLREGSAEVTPDGMYRIIGSRPDSVCFCSDDRSAGDLERSGSILFNVNKAIGLGYDPLRVIKCATHNCAKHYRMERTIGNIRPGMKADFFLSRSLERIKPELVFVDGKAVASNGRAIYKARRFEYPKRVLGTIRHRQISDADIRIPERHRGNVIEAKDGSLNTGWRRAETEGEYDLGRDILKIAVIERYRREGNVAVGQITGFRLTGGAIGSTVAHDCHNIIVVGASDESIVKVANRLIRTGGGFAAYSRRAGMAGLRLPIAGIMTQESPETVIKKMKSLEKAVHGMGCKMKNPFGTLSFMALEVIPELKLTDKGLVDVNGFRLLG